MKKIATQISIYAWVIFFSFFTSLCSPKKEGDSDIFSKPTAQEKAFIDKLTINDNGELPVKIKAELSKTVRDSLIRKYLLEKAENTSPAEYLQNLNEYNKVKLPKPISEGFILEEKAYCFLQLAQLDSSIIYCIKAKDVYKEIPYEHGIITSDFILATVYGLKGDFKLSVNYLEESLKLAESIKDSASIYSAYKELGHCNFNHNQYAKALDYYNKSLFYFKTEKDTFMISDILGAIGSCFFHLGNIEMAEKNIKESLNLKKNLDDVIGTSLCYNSLAACKISQKNWKQGAELLNKARELSHSLSDYRAESNMIHNLGICEMEQNNLDKAESYFIEGIEFGNRTNIRDEGIIKCYEKLFQVKQRKKDYQAAFNYFQKYTAIKDSLYNNANSKTLQELNVKYELKNKEIAFVKLSQEKSKINLQRFLLICFIVVISLGAFLIFWFQREKNNRAKVILNTEKKLKDNQLQMALKEIEFNKTILNDFTTNLIERNKIITELEAKISDEVIVSNQNKVETESMYSLVQLKLLTDQDWAKFKLLFDKVFPEFIIKLRTKYPDLTSAEERIFLLLKVKNDTKEMADALGISVESVRKGKYRLKKKLNLQEETILDDFIKNF